MSLQSLWELEPDIQARPLLWKWRGRGHKGGSKVLGKEGMPKSGQLPWLSLGRCWPEGPRQCWRGCSLPSRSRWAEPGGRKDGQSAPQLPTHSGWTHSQPPGRLQPVAKMGRQYSSTLGACPESSNCPMEVCSLSWLIYNLSEAPPSLLYPLPSSNTLADH